MCQEMGSVDLCRFEYSLYCSVDQLTEWTGLPVVMSFLIPNVFAGPLPAASGIVYWLGAG